MLSGVSCQYDLRENTAVLAKIRFGYNLPHCWCLGALIVTVLDPGSRWSQWKGQRKFEMRLYNLF